MNIKFNKKIFVILLLIKTSHEAIFKYHRDISNIVTDFEIKADIPPIKEMDKEFHIIHEIFEKFVEYESVFAKDKIASKSLFVDSFLDFISKEILDNDHPIIVNILQLQELTDVFLDLDIYKLSVERFLDSLENIYRSVSLQYYTASLTTIKNIIIEYQISKNELIMNIKNIHKNFIKFQRNQLYDIKPLDQASFAELQKKFRNVKYFLGRFNEKMKNTQSIVTNMCHEWNKLSCKEKFIICYGEEHPSNTDSIENLIEKNLEYLMYKFDELLKEINDLFFQYSRYNFDDKDTTIEDIKSLDFLYAYWIYIDSIYEIQKFLRNKKLYMNQMYYKKQKVQFYNSMALKQIKIEKAWESIQNAKNLHMLANSISDWILLHLINNFELVLGFFKKKAEEIYLEMDDKKVELAELSIKKLLLSEDEAKQVVKYLENFAKYRDRFSLSKIKYFYVSFIFLSFEYSTKYSALLYLLKKFEDKLLEFGDAFKDGKSEKIKKKIYFLREALEGKNIIIFKFDDIEEMKRE
ncbi:hypothetical protein H312_00049 [Anncaliia algerae PRA339]|uniref:Dynein heavy chain tail domain-containing protein n=1 Tax=Anncaliia algerae PRA339 TaxID=1288291 RepID=A0A059F5Y6_9MICR|nr:hypothetical protein H312_00049 [Anncaliia algerae PRA339]